MPYKSERIKIAGTPFDGRCVLSEDQRKAIVYLHTAGFSYRKLAEMFKCSKWTIQNLIHPQKRSKPEKKPTVYWTETKREYRRRKQKLYLDGKLPNNKNKK